MLGHKLMGFGFESRISRWASSSLSWCLGVRSDAGLIAQNGHRVLVGRDGEICKRAYARLVPRRLVPRRLVVLEFGRDALCACWPSVLGFVSRPIRGSLRGLVTGSSFEVMAVGGVAEWRPRLRESCWSFASLA